MTGKNERREEFYATADIRDGKVDPEEVKKFFEKMGVKYTVKKVEEENRDHHH